MKKTELLTLARRGALVRKAELSAELAAINDFLAPQRKAEKAAVRKTTAKATKTAARLHWTQTTAGKRKLAKALKASWKTRKAASTQTRTVPKGRAGRG